MTPLTPSGILNDDVDPGDVSGAALLPLFLNMFITDIGAGAGEDDGGGFSSDVSAIIARPSSLIDSVRAGIRF